MLDKVRTLQEADKEYLNELIINGPTLSNQDLHILSQLRGQILALSEVLKTKEFLEDLTRENENETM